MNIQEYRPWLLQRGMAENAINSRISNGLRVEQFYGDLDGLFDRDGLEGLINLFRYTAADEQNNCPNPTEIAINGNYRTNLSMYRYAIGLYQQFRQEKNDSAVVTQNIDPVQLPAVVAQTKKLIGLERDMQVLLRRDIEQLEKGLKIVDDGAERQVSSGRIDITAKDEDGFIVVIELKIGKAGREAIGQILGYISDVIEEEGNADVRGILIADDFDQSARSAARMINVLSLKKYSVSFSFADN